MLMLNAEETEHVTLSSCCAITGENPKNPISPDKPRSTLFLTATAIVPLLCYTPPPPPHPRKARAGRTRAVSIVTIEAMSVDD